MYRKLVHICYVPNIVQSLVRPSRFTPLAVYSDWSAHTFHALVSHNHKPVVFFANLSSLTIAKCLYGYTPFLDEDRTATKIRILVSIPAHHFLCSPHQRHWHWVISHVRAY